MTGGNIRDHAQEQPANSAITEFQEDINEIIIQVDIGPHSGSTTNLQQYHIYVVQKKN